MRLLGRAGRFIGWYLNPTGATLADTRAELEHVRDCNRRSIGEIDQLREALKLIATDSDEVRMDAAAWWRFRTARRALGMEEPTR